MHPYFGKEYLIPVTKERWATEITSMGPEEFWKDPANLLSKDPGVYKLTIKIMHLG